MRKDLVKNLVARVFALLLTLLIPNHTYAAVLPDCQSIPAQWDRADSNGDGDITIDDAIYTLWWLFTPSTAPLCQQRADFQNDGVIQLPDVILTLRFLFRSGNPPSEPRHGDVPIEDQPTQLFIGFDFMDLTGPLPKVPFPNTMFIGDSSGNAITSCEVNVTSEGQTSQYFYQEWGSQPGDPIVTEGRNLQFQPLRFGVGTEEDSLFLWFTPRNYAIDVLCMDSEGNANSLYFEFDSDVNYYLKKERYCYRQLEGDAPWSDACCQSSVGFYCNKYNPPTVTRPTCDDPLHERAFGECCPGGNAAFCTLTPEEGRKYLATGNPDAPESCSTESNEPTVTLPPGGGSAECYTTRMTVLYKSEENDCARRITAGLPAGVNSKRVGYNEDPIVILNAAGGQQVQNHMGVGLLVYTKFTDGSDPKRCKSRQWLEQQAIAEGSVTAPIFLDQKQEWKKIDITKNRSLNANDGDLLGGTDVVNQRKFVGRSGQEAAFDALACYINDNDQAKFCNDDYNTAVAGGLYNLYQPPRKIWQDCPGPFRAYQQKLNPDTINNVQTSLYMMVEDSAPQLNMPSDTVPQYWRVICKLTGIEIVVKPLSEQTAESAGYQKLNPDGSDPIQCRCWRQFRSSQGGPWVDGPDTGCGPM